jgi:rubrerythrin
MEDDQRSEEASYQDGQQVPYGGVTPFMTRSGDKAMGGVPAQFGPRGHADPKHRTPGMDAFFGEEPPQVPPNLRESDGTSFEMCGTCVHHNGKRLCALYSAGTDRDDICDSWYSLTPPEQRNRALAYVTSANDVDEAKRDGTGSQVTTALRHQQHAFALLEAAVEQTGGDELDKLAQKFIRRGMPPEAAKKAAKKALARKRVAEARAGVEGFGLVEVEESGHKIKCPKCGHVMSASLSKCPNCGHDMTEARKAKFAKLDEAAQRDLLLDEPEAADALAGWRLDEATLTAAKRKKLSKSDYAIPESESYPIHDESHARNALARVSQHGSPAEKKRVRAAVKRKYPHVVKEAAELVEVKSSAYPGLERKPGKQNWVDYAGGLPSYIERIAKHIHYEHGHPIGQAIAFAVGTVRRWCAGGSVTKGGASKSNVSRRRRRRRARRWPSGRRRRRRGARRCTRVRRRPTPTSTSVRWRSRSRCPRWRRSTSRCRS